MAKRKDWPKPAVSADALRRFGPQLDAIGPYQLSAGPDGVDVEWERPTGLPDLGFPGRVAFVIDTDAGNLDPDDRMFALWDRFLAGIDRHATHFRREMVAVYREVQADLVEQDEFPPDLPDAAVLRLVRGTITVKRHEQDGEIDYWLDVSFAARWDGEHAWEFEYDEAADSFGESSRGEATRPTQPSHHKSLVLILVTPGSGRHSMLIVSGRIHVRPGVRQKFLASSLEAVVQARAAAGCRDFVVAADPIDPDRVNVYEEWESEDALLTFRGNGPGEDLSSWIVRAEVSRHVVASSVPA